jgi:ribonuclease P protein component
VFDRFRTDGRRFRHGLVRCTWISDAAAVPPRVGYGIGRAAGGAVVRNRVRRRLRAAVRAEADVFPPGWYLLSAGSAAATAEYGSLRASVHALVSQIREEATR